MRYRLFALLATLCVCAGCNKPPAALAKPEPDKKKTASTESAAAEPARPLPDACTLLTGDEIKSVLGEQVQQTKPTNQSSGEMATSQCYFALPTAANSAVLSVIRRGSGNATRDWWQEAFHKEHEEEKGEGEKKARPEKVDRLGDEAFWAATKIGGALYVLKGDTTIRISVGGRDDLAAKLAKSRALAEIVLKRL